MNCIVLRAFSLPAQGFGHRAEHNLDSILKSRDITLPINVHLWFLKKVLIKVKAVVFPVVIYGCESWTVKKAERGKIDAF